MSGRLVVIGMLAAVSVVLSVAAFTIGSPWPGAAALALGLVAFTLAIVEAKS